MASSYVFRKIDGDLWRQARARCLSLNVKFLDVVEKALRDYLRTTSAKVTRYTLKIDCEDAVGGTWRAPGLETFEATSVDAAEDEAITIAREWITGTEPASARAETVNAELRSSDGKIHELLTVTADDVDIAPVTGSGKTSDK